MTIRQKKSLFTLLEVLVSMGVFAVLMLALMQFFVTAKDVWDKTGTKTQLYDNTRIAMDLLAKDLMTAFYGDEYDPSTYRLFQCDISSSAPLESTIQVTLASQRTEGMTEVNYVWDYSNLTFSLATISETDPTYGAIVVDTSTSPPPNIKNPNWCTYPSTTAWISTIRDTAKAPRVTILDNILAFHITCKDYSFNDVTATAKLPPYMVEVTMVVVDPLVYDLLAARIKARLGTSTTEEEARISIRTTFKAMLTDSSNPQKGFKDSSNFAEGSEELILYQGTQFFKRAVMIDQDRYQ